MYALNKSYSLKQLHIGDFDAFKFLVSKIHQNSCNVMNLYFEDIFEVPSIRLQRFHPKSSVIKKLLKMKM